MKIAVAAAIALLIIACPLIALLVMSDTPTLKIEPAVKVVGNETPVHVHVDDPHGVRTITAFLEQNGQRHKVYEVSDKPTRVLFFRKHVQPRVYTFTAGKKQAQALQDGKARLVVEAVSNDLRGSSAVATNDVEVNTNPLTVAADGFQHYINQGGTELVTFTVSGYWTEAGVRVGTYTFRSWPMPGETDPNSSKRFSLFAFPWNVPANTVPIVYARNPTGTEVTAQFWFRVFPKQFRKSTIELPDTFLQKVVNELDPNGSGDLLGRFLRINRDMRRQNNQQLADMRLKSEPKVLWSGPFWRLGKVESFFADNRTYMYKGQKVDEQTHLGFDLSDVQGSPVKASNSGRVVHAAPLGIYGNCIVLDHGYGLQSIYGHMRDFSVKEGDTVQKEQVMGRSDSTGLAAGDHVHFSMQVDGVQVNPIEWWDEHWIKDRILSKIPPQSAPSAAR